MSHARVAITAAILAGWLGCLLTPARAQGLVTQKALSTEMAQAVVQGAMEKCRAEGWRVSVTVVNAEGLTKLALRDDGATPHTFDLSRRKAYTAVTQRRNSGEVAQQWVGIPVPNIEGIVALAGGVPIKAGNDVIAAVGVSGAPAGQPAGVNDEACANAGIAKIAAKLK